MLNDDYQNFACTGYNLQCDLRQLSHSYGDLECFRYYEMLLDIQKLFNEPSGGLSGLAQVFKLIIPILCFLFVFSAVLRATVIFVRSFFFFLFFFLKQ